MKTLRLSLLSLGLALLSGCATPFRAPSDVAHLKLARVDSASVLIDKIWLERDAGALVVRGYVHRKLDAATTTGTHLDVTLRDNAGRILRRQIAGFTPGEVPPSHRPPAAAGYRVPLDPLPPDAAHLEVRAHDSTPLDTCVAGYPAQHTRENRAAHTE